MSRGKSMKTAASRPEATRFKSAPQKRILVISHSHPELTKGGAEIAAYNHYLKCAESNPDTTWFVGCSRDPNGQHVGAVFSQPFGPQEYVYACGAFDWFNFSNMDARFPDEFRALLSELRPDEVHFHHYINIGLEAILHVKETLPDCRITLTLHEYLAICHHYGQMVTKPTLTLCYGSSPRKCTKCFPEKSPEDFFLRKRYIDRFFSLIDQFFSPSEFLATRYHLWGIDPSRIRVGENLVFVDSVRQSINRKPRMPDAPLRVGFFGQISKLKGIGVLLDAAAILAADEDWRIVFELYGGDEGQPPEFQAEFRSRIQSVGKNVIYFGAYAREQVGSLMAEMDAVLVPSIWWENSPLVIQEAIHAGVRVVCSDIGGMLEKSAHESVETFPVANPIALAAVLRALADRLVTSSAARRALAAERESQ